ncbi:MAG: hypothetical protein ABSD31_01210 [Candidatus Binataceae bacterium]|jgi:hypothetical protein
MKDIPYFRFTVKGATVEFRASAPLTKEHFALVAAYLKAFEDDENAQTDPKSAPFDTGIALDSRGGRGQNL